MRLACGPDAFTNRFAMLELASVDVYSWRALFTRLGCSAASCCWHSCEPDSAERSACPWEGQKTEDYGPPRMQKHLAAMMLSLAMVSLR